MLSTAIRGLYAITPDSTNTVNLLSMTEQVLTGGATVVQYRNKIVDAAVRQEQAYLRAQLCKKHKALLIINDHVDLVLAVGANGVHMGQDDGCISEARNRLGVKRIIGVSCYNQLNLAIDASQQGADYVAFGAFFASSTKPDAVTASTDLLCKAKQKLMVPIVTIGGITLTNAATLIDQGGDAIAVSNALFDSQDIQSTARSFSQLFCE